MATWGRTWTAYPGKGVRWAIRTGDRHAALRTLTCGEIQTTLWHRSGGAVGWGGTCAEGFGSNMNSGSDPKKPGPAYWLVGVEGKARKVRLPINAPLLVGRGA